MYEDFLSIAFHVLLCFIGCLAVFAVWIFGLGFLVSSDYLLAALLWLSLHLTVFIPMILTYWVLRRLNTFAGKILSRKTMVYYTINVLIPFVVAIVFFNYPKNDISNVLVGLLVVTTPIQIGSGLLVVFTGKLLLDTKTVTPDPDKP